ncbi:anti-sigma F factor antagonist [Desulfitobacterium chlororespirans]|uniref:Anti-sigma F factor antagonist n=1 Tax=Desulfitobacterium chlororespirans DSM 11544 TaxID=1121395 RepID=A0A1M7U5R2_9FIRM|nr:anti-sigma F factor antagonist [Desulfitobacterium chlororespirans]SHN78227.1 anti-sigma-factor antagonist /anti-anti-sigma regulatory factor, SpoIIAA [Desulfitobacterium chlororespirans DSM 11544]
MLIDKKLERQTLLLTLKGELDMNTSESLRQTIDSEIERRGVRTVVLNLEDISFIDSSGLGVILGRYKKLLPMGGKVIITRVPPHIYKIMELSGLPRIIQFEDMLNQEDGRKGKTV